MVFVSRGKFRFNCVISEGEARAKDVAHKANVILDTLGVRAALNLIRAKDESELAVPTMREYAAKWERSLEHGQLKRCTRNGYRSVLKIHVMPDLGARLVTEISYSVIKEYLEAKAARGYARDTLRLHHSTLRLIMGEAVRDGYVASNPVQGLSRYYSRRKDRTIRRHQVFSLDELYSVEDQLRGDDYPFTLTMSRTGMRIGEVIGLRPSDLDLKARTIVVERNVPAAHGVPEDSCKTHDSERVVDMGEDLHAALVAYIARRREEEFAGRRAPSEWLFNDGRGGHFQYRSYVRRWNLAQARAKVRQRTVHSLRHTYASQQLEAGVSLADVAKQLGHANPGITLQIYSHFVPKSGRAIRNALDRQRTNGAAKCSD